MDSEKAYNELIEKLNDAKEKHGGYTFASVIDTILPELKESEDERIRRWLYNDVRAAIENGFYNDERIDDAKDALAWLEKQGDNKPAWSEKDERILNGLISSLARIGANTRTDSTSINYTFSREIDWLKSLKPCWKPTEEQISELGKAAILQNVRFNKPILESLYNDLKSL